MCEPCPFGCAAGACKLEPGPEPCATDAECEPGETCFPDGCAADACDIVTCPVGELCYKGGCFDACPCVDPIQNVCYPIGPDGICGSDNLCEDITCGVEQQCYEGTCFDLCPCVGPEMACYDAQYCVEGPGHCTGIDCESPMCDEMVCAEGWKCHMGSCFPECNVSADCLDPARPHCINTRCTEDSCDGILCPDGRICYKGTCIENVSCSSDVDCTDPGHHCFLKQCIPDNCADIECGIGQVCDRGTCFNSCEDDGDCVDPMLCFDKRCARNACEARLGHYDANHPFRTLTGNLWPSLTQVTGPESYPRPVLLAGPVTDWQATLNARLNTGQPATDPKRARVALFLDEASEQYVLLLLHGHTAGTGTQSATYTIRYSGADNFFPKTPSGDVLASWGHVEEQVFNLEAGNDEGPRVHQIRVESGPNTRGGVALGPFPIDARWNLSVQNAFRGGITGWEFYSGIMYSQEINQVVFDGKSYNNQSVVSTDIVEYIELVLGERFVLTPHLVPHTSDSLITPEMGVITCEPAGAKGICSKGTYGVCRYGAYTCDKRSEGLPYDVCDGRDTNCDGTVDNIAAMYVHQASVRQNDAPWVRVLTTDTPGPVDTILNYDAATYSTDVRRKPEENTELFGEAIQDPQESVFLFHRDLTTGIVSMPLLHGARVIGAEAEAFPESSAVSVDMVFNPGPGVESHPGMLFLSWYDDWRGPHKDAVPTDISAAGISMASNLRRFEANGQSVRESDTAVAQFTWRNALPTDPMQFRLEYTLPDSPNRVRAYVPYIAKRPFHPTTGIDVRLEAVHINESVCMAPTAIAGCRMTRYTCDQGALSCAVTAASDCNDVGCFDVDGDGFFGVDDACPEGLDCDDNNAGIHPMAVEKCDGVDRNCDGHVDGIGPLSLNESCPDGREVCGPAECDYHSSCVCRAIDDCSCTGGLGEP